MTIANRRDVSLEGPDHYPTPPWAVRALLEKEKFEGRIAEPCCGAGYMVRALEESGLTVIGSDLYDHGFGATGVDARKIGPVDNVVTNPPYNIAGELLPYFLKAAKKKVAILMRLSFLESRKRYPLFQNQPPARVYIFPERLSFAPAGKVVKGGGTISHGWMIWDKAHNGASELHWLNLGHKTHGIEQWVITG
jgi:hypothetical protein